MGGLPREAVEALRAGVLQIGDGCRISSHAVFEFEDILGETRPICLGDRCRLGPGAIVHGGVEVDTGVVIEEQAVVGKPEYGYAVGRMYPGAGGTTRLGAGTVIRSGAIVYAMCEIGEEVAVGHHTLLRTSVQIGPRSQLAHYISVERAARMGASVRCSPLCHITSQVVLEDHVFLGAGVVTINDKGMIWRDPDRAAELSPPYFETGARVGSGAVIAAGARIGARALIGSGASRHSRHPRGRRRVRRSRGRSRHGALIVPSGACAWLAVASLDSDDCEFISAFDAALSTETTDGPLSGRALLAAKRRLAGHGWGGVDVHAT